MKRALAVLVVALAAWLAFGAPASAQNRARFAHIELVGPVEDVVLEVGRAGRTRIDGRLLAGETRRVSVPLPIDAEASGAQPLLEPLLEPIVRFSQDAGDLEARGRVRFLAWSAAPSPLAVLPASLRARTRPALAESAVSASRAAPLVLAATLVLALALRRRPWLALLGSLVAAVALHPLVSAAERDAEAAVILLDGEAGSLAWRRVDAAFDEISLPQEVDAFELWSEPASAPITWRVSLDTALPWRAEARGARLFVASVRAVGESQLARARNGLAAFDATWVREEGQWSAHGAWGLDEPLPPKQSGGSPPGWLASQLPQGVTILIAREVVAPRRAVGWVRVSGL